MHPFLFHILIYFFSSLHFLLFILLLSALLFVSRFYCSVLCSVAFVFLFTQIKQKWFFLSDFKMMQNTWHSFINVFRRQRGEINIYKICMKCVFLFRSHWIYFDALMLFIFLNFFFHSSLTFFHRLIVVFYDRHIVANINWNYVEKWMFSKNRKSITSSPKVHSRCIWPIIHTTMFRQSERDEKIHFSLNHFISILKWCARKRLSNNLRHIPYIYVFSHSKRI